MNSLINTLVTFIDNTLILIMSLQTVKIAVIIGTENYKNLGAYKFNFM